MPESGSAIQSGHQWAVQIHHHPVAQPAVAVHVASRVVGMKMSASDPNLSSHCWSPGGMEQGRTKGAFSSNLFRMSVIVASFFFL